MLLQISEVLTRSEAACVRAALDTADWGKNDSPSGPARGNLQLPEDHSVGSQLGQRVFDALDKSPLFMSASLPLSVFPPVFHRYEGGRTSGAHVDRAVCQLTGTSESIRSDLSAILFLTPPEDYDGGELVVEDTYGTQSIKLPPGDLILYPASSLYHVCPVTRGAHIFSFFWIQSMVRDNQCRRLLFDLDMAIQRINAQTPEHPSAVQLTGVYHNLIRMWSEV